jgi:DivIVA domain-containing protein
VLLVVEVVVVAAIIFVVGALAVGRLDRMAPMPRDSVPDGLPAGPLAADDMSGIRFDLAFRGYRMDQVDLVLARLAAELAHRDAEIDRLRAGQGAPDG